MNMLYELLSEQQEQELRRLKQYFPYRIVFGVIDKDTSQFQTYVKRTMHTANNMTRKGHKVFILK